jgi:hypothetical protein
MLNMELVEHKDIMQKLEYVAEYGNNAGTTMRLMKPWFGSNKILVADSWFGSLKLAVALKHNGLWSVMNVKQCHKGFPKARLIVKCP